MWKNSIGKNSTLGNLTSTAPDSKLELSTSEIITLSLLNGISSPIGTLGNLLVIAAVVNNKNIQTKPDLFIASLACADLLVNVVSQPMLIYYVNNYGATMFDKIKALIGYFSLLASVSNILVVSVDRFFSIRFPLKYKLFATTKKTLIMVAMAWSLSLGIALEYTAEYTVSITTTSKEPNALFLWIYCTFSLVTTVVLYVYILAVAIRRKKQSYTLGTIQTHLDKEASTSNRGPRTSIDR